MDLDRLAPRNGGFDARDGAMHIAQQKWIVQIFDARIQETTCRNRIPISAIPENTRHLTGKRKLFRQGSHAARPGLIKRRGKNPAASCSSRSRRGHRRNHHRLPPATLW